MQFCFGDIVVVDGKNIGVVVKSWIKVKNQSYEYDVYVRMYNEIRTYKESDIQRHMVRHKYLSEEELEYQFNAIHGV